MKEAFLYAALISKGECHLALLVQGIPSLKRDFGVRVLFPKSLERCAGYGLHNQLRFQIGINAIREKKK